MCCPGGAGGAPPACQGRALASGGTWPGAPSPLLHPNLNRRGGSVIPPSCIGDAKLQAGRATSRAPFEQLSCSWLTVTPSPPHHHIKAHQQWVVKANISTGNETGGSRGRALSPTCTALLRLAAARYPGYAALNDCWQQGLQPSYAADQRSFPNGAVCASYRTMVLPPLHPPHPPNNWKKTKHELGQPLQFLFVHWT